MATAHRSARAEIDLMEIWGHIASDDPLAADLQLDRIDEACQMLAGYPRAGKNRDDLARVLDLKFVDGRLESVSGLSAEMAKIREQQTTTEDYNM